MKVAFSPEGPDKKGVFRKAKNGGITPTERRRSQNALYWMMEALCRINQGEIVDQAKKGNPFKPLYDSGIYYLREPPGEEQWQDIYVNFAKGNGDCEDLACHRVAELREVLKIPASPFVTFRKVDGNQFGFHALVAVRDGAGPNGWRLEDPSRKLGMGWEAKFAATPVAKRKQLMAMMDPIQRRTSHEMLKDMRRV